MISDTTSSGSASYALTYASGANTVPLITGVTESNGSTVGYNYDALYRLTSDTRTGTNPFSGSYAYDLAGNPTSYNGTSHSYNGGDLLSTASYDGDGNPTAGTFGGHSSTLTWNDSNELTAFTNSIATITNGYKANGLRGWSEVGSGAKTYYVYSGGVLLGEVSATGSPISAYTWGNGLISEHRYDTSSPTSFWYLFGPQGETRYLTNSAGAVTDTYTYSAYGELIASTGTDTNPFHYGGSVGDYSDSNTGLILCGGQWYDPTLGQCLNSSRAYYPGGGGNIGGGGSYTYSRTVSYSSGGGGGTVGGGPSPIGHRGGPTGGMRTGGSGGGATGGGSTGDGGGASGGGIGERPIIMYPRHPCPPNSGTSGGPGNSPGSGPDNGPGLGPVLGVGGIFKTFKGGKGREYTYREDMREQPNPDLHIFRGNKEWIFDHNGNLITGKHHGQLRETEIPKGDEEVFSGIVRGFVNKVNGLGVAPPPPVVDEPGGGFTPPVYAIPGEPVESGPIVGVETGEK